MNKNSIFKLSLLISISLLPSCVTPVTNPQVSPSTSVSVSPSSDVTLGVGDQNATASPNIQTSSSPVPSVSATASSQPNPVVSASANVNTTTALTIPSEFLSLSYYDYYSAELKWKEITGAKSYRIYQDGKVIADNLTSAIYYVKNLTPHTNYKFDIVAVNDGGESNKSTISMRTFIPSTPTNNNYNYVQEPVNPRNVPVGNVIFVDLNSTYGSNNGTTWNNAYINLQDALNAATSGKQIWVAKGIYYPSTPIMLEAATGGRNASFEIPAGVKVYGGFAGTELTMDNRSISANVTTLSGDINRNDQKFEPKYFGIKGKNLNNYENSYHVVSILGTEDTSNTGSVIDGFTITAGNANGGGRYRISAIDPEDNNYGAGLIIKNASPIINNVIFTGNNADSRGGAIYAVNEGEVLNSKNTVNITGSKFVNNYSDNDGGAIYNNNFTANITNSTFTNNSAQNNGGGIYNNYSTGSISNSIFNDNTSTSYGKAIYNYFSEVLVPDNNTINSNNDVYNDTCC